jgi:hypothetical protein
MQSQKKIQNRISFSSLLGALFLSSVAFSASASHKCTGADGKVEYRDQPCGHVVAATTAKADSTKAAPAEGIAPTDKYAALFSEFETKLCDRERLASEVDRAARSGKPQGPDFKTKEDKLRELNDELVQFQGRLSRLTAGKAFESQEMVNVRQFQAKVRKCGKLTN